MLDKIIIIDFEDSFTYNIASVLFPYEKRMSVISHHDFFKFHLLKYLNSQETYAIILGPGPGHPLDYQKYFLKIEEFRKSKSCYLMGICLGHQIIGLIDNKAVLEAQKKIHGQTVQIEFDGIMRGVQRYNSLAVYEDNVEMNIRRFERGVTYQFHPESVGTYSNLLYFRELLEFIQGS